MIHEIAPHKFDNQYHEGRKPEAESPVIIFHQKEILTLDEEVLSFPAYKQVEESLTACTYIFELDGTSYFLGTVDEKINIPDTVWHPWSYIRDVEPQHLAFASMTAMHLDSWYKGVRFCGHCGAKALHHEKIRAMVCPSCGSLMFPRINPAVIVAITDGQRLLMTHYAHRNGFYALIAGFIEIGETAEECVAREVMEEVGLHIKNIRYYDSQPWGFDGNLMLGYTAELDDSHRITLDHEELKDAVWLRPEDVPEANENSSLTREMIRRFKNGVLFS